MSNIELFNEDCMVGMARYPDKHFELAIVDPPYGINTGTVVGGASHLVKVGGEKLSRPKHTRGLMTPEPLTKVRIHPTQKPVKLYEWLLRNYAKLGDKILDTHLGSGSIAIACHNLGFDLVGFEIDKDYFEAASERLRKHQAQKRMFEPGEVKAKEQVMFE